MFEIYKHFKMNDLQNKLKELCESPGLKKASFGFLDFLLRTPMSLISCI